MNAFLSAIEVGLDDLSKLELTGLLTTEESKQVLKRRSKYEHALARRHGRNERVFLAYIDYETTIERLLKLRAKVLNMTGSGTLVNILKPEAETWYQESQHPAFNEAHASSFKSFYSSKYVESAFVAYFHT